MVLTGDVDHDNAFSTASSLHCHSRSGAPTTKTGGVSTDGDGPYQETEDMAVTTSNTVHAQPYRHCGGQDTTSGTQALADTMVVLQLEVVGACRPYQTLDSKISHRSQNRCSVIL